MDNVVESRAGTERGPGGLSHESPKAFVMRGVEVLLRSPTGDVDKAERGVRRKRAVQLVFQVAWLLPHVRVDLLPHCEELVLASGGYFETVDQSDGWHGTSREKYTDCPGAKALIDSARLRGAASAAFPRRGERS